MPYSRSEVEDWDENTNSEGLGKNQARILKLFGTDDEEVDTTCRTQSEVTDMFNNEYDTDKSQQSIRSSLIGLCEKGEMVRFEGTRIVYGLSDKYLPSE